MTVSRTRSQEVNDATYAAWNAHDADAVAAVFADNAVVHDVATGEEIHGRDAIRERAARLFVAFPDLALERIELVVDGNRHADRWILTGTHQGGLLGLPPTGRRVRLVGATFTHMRADGLVAEDHQLADVAGLVAQLAS